MAFDWYKAAQDSGVPQFVAATPEEATQYGQQIWEEAKKADPGITEEDAASQALAIGQGIHSKTQDGSWDQDVVKAGIVAKAEPQAAAPAVQTTENALNPVLTAAYSHTGDPIYDMGEGFTQAQKYQTNADAQSRLKVTQGREDKDWQDKQADLADSKDPNSRTSQMYQQVATELTKGQKFDGASAQQLAKVFPGIEKLAEIRAKEDAINAKGPVLTKGQESVDKKFGDDYADWNAGGGLQQTKRTIDTVRQGLNALEKGEATTGAGRTLVDKLAGWAVPGLDDADMDKMIYSKSNEAQQNIETGVISSLKQILGGQFTQNEGSALLARTFDPKLSKEENLRRGKALLTQLEEQANNKDKMMRYYEENGSLVGYSGPKVSLDTPLDSTTPATSPTTTSTKEETKIVHGKTYKKVPGGWAPL